MATHHHHHAHGHGHEHAIEATNRAFVVGVILNLSFVLVETGYGISANSLSLLADAGHNFSDVIALLAAWGAMLLSKRLPSPRFTYGLRGSTILVALANAMLLLIAVGGIAWESVRRFTQPSVMNETTVIWVALTGVVINAVTAFMLMGGSKHDLNMRGAFLHMAADAVISLSVALAGAVMLWTGWLWLDPAVSLVIAILIFWGTWDLFKQSLKLSLHAVPEAIDPEDVQRFLAAWPCVQAVHDLHIWGMSTTETALTVHLVVGADHPGNDYLHTLAHELEHQFGISHATIQVELGNTDTFCSLAPSDVV